MGMIAYAPVPHYIYDNGDTVFAYNYLYNRFTPLYVFNVNAGDTVCLPIYPGDYHDVTDSTYCIVIDSVKMEYQDTSLLKTVYNHAVITPNKSFCSFAGNSAADTVGVYAERIGSLKTGLYPHCMNCIYLNFYEQVQIESPRCYSDSNAFIKLVSNDCDKGITPGTGIKNIPDQNNISITPNPASDFIDIAASKELSVVRLFTTDGKRVIEYIHPTPSRTCKIDVSSLPAGLYILQYQYSRGTAKFAKLLIQ